MDSGVLEDRPGLGLGYRGRASAEKLKVASS